MQVSYNYYKNKIINTLPNVLDNILQQWNKIYKDLYINITYNKDNFKSSINELYITANTYNELYISDILYDNINSVIERLKKILIIQINIIIISSI